MINGMTEAEFIRDPNTASFIVRRNAYFERFASLHPEILMTEPLLGQFWIGYTNYNNFPLLMEEFGSSFISSVAVVMGLLGRPSLDATGITPVQEHPFLDLRGGGVLIGFVDTGIAYTNEVFLYEDGTSKIQYIYDQTVDGTAPEGFYFGAEYTNAQINEALRAEDPYSVVPHRDTNGHGTFLASVAAGRETGNFIGAAPDSDLVVVKLKKASPYYLERNSVPPDQEDAFESSDVMIGVEYILNKASELNRPVVICISVGTNFGGHDGFSFLEQYLSNIANIRGVCLCTSAGNESQSRHHAQGRLTARGETQNIDVYVGENAYSVVISVFNAAPDRFSVSVRSPTGELVGPVPPKIGTQVLVPLLLEGARVGVDYFFPMEGSGAQLTVVRLLDPTPGIWTITLHGDLVLDGTYHAWLPVTGFVSPNIEFLTANPYYTIVIPATMFGSIVCAAGTEDNESLYPNSSWGPTRLPAMSPDLTAPGMDVTGYYPLGYGVMSGTSVAAAITAGACALFLEWGIEKQNEPSMSTYQVRAYLMRGCDRSEMMEYPNYKWGYGRLNLMQSFNLMRES